MLVKAHAEAQVRIVCVYQFFKKRAAARKVGDARRGPCRGMGRHSVHYLCIWFVAFTKRAEVRGVSCICYGLAAQARFMACWRISVVTKTPEVGGVSCN
jgi:hypothetical protein